MGQTLEASEVAQALSRYVNSMSSKAAPLAWCIARDHRTLQQKTMEVFLATIMQWARDHDEGNFDLRNQVTCELSARIRDMILADPRFIKAVGKVEGSFGDAIGFEYIPLPCI